MCSFRLARMRARRKLHVAAVDIGVLYGQFGNHFTDYVVQVGAMRDIWQELAVALAQGFPIVAACWRRRRNRGTAATLR